ncbi:MULTISPECIES: hypothetical protein [Dyella]|uniref:Uncharacterized protein n=2 Tax=Dyella TaxID=231454 RepID=A0A4R0YD24_9GAMM|nr:MULTISPECIES: hypothetical protein [Dyella]TBR36251.1 hypothetical protein EYV96_16825 [Dyella terrae]TCI05908.1 hypothetical protein EZM97_35915 [Dyella soli]
MNSSLIRVFLPWFLLLVVGALTAALRFGVIEPSDMAHLCDGSASNPAWCQWRQWVVLGFLGYGYGWAALLAAAVALVWKRPFAAWLAAAVGLFALMMYCFEAGAFALLVGSLRLVRFQATAAPADENGQRDRQVQPQP